MQDAPEQSFTQDTVQGAGGTDTSISGGNGIARLAVGAGAQEEPVDKSSLLAEIKADMDEALAELKELEALNDPELANDIEHLKADLEASAWEYNALNDYDYVGSFDEFADASGRLYTPMDEQTGTQRRQSIRALGPSYMAAASGWDFFSVSPLDAIPIGKGIRLAGWFIRKATPRALSRLFRRVRERIRRRGRNRRRRRECRRRSNPVMMPTGISTHDDPSFLIPGLMPLSLHSTYWSDLNRITPLGRNRMAPFDAMITRNDAGGFDLIDDDGFAVRFAAPTPIPEGWVEGDTVRPLKLLQDRGRALVLKDGRLRSRFDNCSDGVWRIGQIGDPNGNILRFDRDTGHRITTVHLPDGLSVAFDYDGDLRRAATLIAPSGAQRQIMAWRYDAQGNMAKCICPYGATHTFGYDEQGRLNTVDRDGDYTARYEFDDQGRRIRTQTNGPFHNDQFRYDPAARQTVYLPGGDEARRETFHYNEHGNITAEENALGQTWRTEENEDGYVAADIDPLGNCTAYRYDPEGNIKSVRDPLDRFTYFGWTAEGSIDLLVDHTGASWDYEYDSGDNLVSVTDPTGKIADIKVTAQGQIAGISRHDGMIKQVRYDANFRVAAIVDFDGGETLYDRDEFGRITGITDPLGAASTISYTDQPGLDFYMPSQIVRPDGGQTRLRIEQDGRVELTADATGAVTSKSYDSFGNLRSLTDARGAVVRFGYDDQLRLDRVENAAGQVWSFSRDVAGRIVTEVEFSGLTLTYTYDDADRLSTMTYPDGRVTHYTWDAAGQLIGRRVEYSDGQMPLVESYAYDGRGLMTRAQGPGAVVEREYDAIGNMVAEVCNDQRIESTYDCCGRRTSRRIGTDLTAYNYSPTGALTRVQIDGKTVLTIQRDLVGNPLSHTSGAAFRLDQTFDIVGQMTAQVVQGSDGWTRDYQWTPALSPRRIGDPLWGASEYDKDDNGQVTEARHGFGDPGGLRLAKAAQGLVPGFPAETVEVERFAYAATQDIAASDTSLPQMPLGRPMSGWTSAAGGRVEQAVGPLGESIQLTYDVCGRVTQRLILRNGFRPQVWQFGWDGLDRLATCLTPEGTRWDYVYDPLGRRIEKRSAGATTRFVWDENVIATELVSGQSPVHWHFEPGTFTPLLRVGSQVAHVITDHLGTPRDLVDAGGALLWSAQFRLWGKDRGQWGDPGLCPIRFPGQWFDAESGLHYNRYRMYDPLCAQYLSPDPVGLWGGTRSAGYVSQPLDDTDPLGLNPLRGALGLGVGQPYQAHHIIPKEIWALNQGFFDQIGMGSSRDVAANGIALPNNEALSRRVGLPYHCSNHPLYSTSAGGRVALIRRQFVLGNIDAATARSQIGALQQSLRTEIRGGLYGGPGVRIR